ncbi:MarR family winged helix-turn-helix transcriptional regulator [Sphingomonas sp. BK580]|uniref:MarR family winged helix-turn-helix transcriptional regulator n=1 Tax=Sphingomonas sp. BK580 TaxID=2586972 RepID=UPI0016088B4A|nr:MarR family winged helix-turn-helix transcriptional regulator [Sphingomonas sp. BK580]MBB3693613.1 DNA-binding MarR family transcriptional regulator [Sphingomonas sp. BK580]
MANDGDDYSRAYGGLALAARLRRLSERLDRDGTRVYEAHGVRFEQRWYGVLRQLLANGPMTVGEIADTLRISHASVSEARRSLEREGILVATQCPSDARRRILDLTPAGRRLCDRLRPLWDDFNATALELNDEAGDLVRFLDRLEDALERRSMFDRMQARRSGSD